MNAIAAALLELAGAIDSGETGGCYQSLASKAIGRNKLALALAELAAKDKALEPFAKFAERFDADNTDPMYFKDSYVLSRYEGNTITLGDIRAARSVK